MDHTGRLADERLGIGRLVEPFYGEAGSGDACSITSGGANAPHARERRERACRAAEPRGLPNERSE